MKLRPLHDRVLLRRLESESKTSGGIIIPSPGGSETMAQYAQQDRSLASQSDRLFCFALWRAVSGRRCRRSTPRSLTLFSIDVLIAAPGLGLRVVASCSWPRSRLEPAAGI